MLLAGRVAWCQEAVVDLLLSRIESRDAVSMSPASHTRQGDEELWLGRPGGNVRGLQGRALIEASCAVFYTGPGFDRPAAACWLRLRVLLPVPRL